MTANQIPQLPLHGKFLFDNLPLDVIQYVIYPYLDYNSKVTMNCMLPPQDRIRSPLVKGAGVSIVIKILGRQLAKQITKCLDTTGLSRTRIMMTLMRNYAKYYMIFQHCKAAREANIIAMQDFSNTESHRYGGSSKYVREKISAMAAGHLANIEALPYISEYQQIKCCDHWSAVGAGNHLIVRAFGGSPLVYKQTTTCFRLPGFDEWNMENYSH